MVLKTAIKEAKLLIEIEGTLKKCSIRWNKKISVSYYRLPAIVGRKRRKIPKKNEIETTKEKTLFHYQ